MLNAAFTARWMCGTLRNDVCSVTRRGVALDQALAHAAVDADVGAAKAVDRLLGIADDEEPAGANRQIQRVAGEAVGLGSGEHPQQVGLKRIGVLELVDENEAEAGLKLAAHRRHIADQVARADQQVEKVERAGACLPRLELLDAGRQLVVQQRRHVGVGVGTEPHDAVDEQVARFAGGLARHGLRILPARAAALAQVVLTTRQRAQAAPPIRRSRASRASAADRSPCGRGATPRSI